MRASLQRESEKSALIPHIAAGADPDLGVTLGLSPQAPNSHTVGVNRGNDLGPLTKAVEPALQQCEVTHRVLYGCHVHGCGRKDVSMQAELSLEKLRCPSIHAPMRAREE